MANEMYYGNYGYNSYNPGAYQYQVQQVPMTQPLTQEEINKLKTKTDDFTLAVNELDLLRAKCTHKNNNQIVVQQTDDGRMYCPICGEVFSPVSCTEEEAKKAVDIVIDIMQNSKLQYVDIPLNVANSYYSMIPLLRKLPRLYEIAKNRFNKFEQGNAVIPSNDMRSFNMLNSLMGGGYGMPMQYSNPVMNGQMGVPMQQPMMAPQMGQPMMNGQMGVPMQQPMMAPQMPQGNPFMAPAAPQAPVANAPVQNPTTPAAPQAPVAEPATGTGTVTSTKVLNV